MDDLLRFPLGPQSIVCLSKGAVEWRRRSGQENRSVGISGYTLCLRREREDKPKVSAFLSARTDKIMDLRLDYIPGFKDLKVSIFRQRGVAEICSMLDPEVAMLGEGHQGLQRIAGTQGSLQAMQDALAVELAAGACRLKVFLEEWDTLHISTIRWVSDLTDGVAKMYKAILAWMEADLAGDFAQ